MSKTVTNENLNKKKTYVLTAKRKKLKIFQNNFQNVQELHEEFFI